MTGPGELGAVSSCLVRTLPCPPAVPQQTSHFHFPREATRPNKPEQGLSVCTRASLVCCLVSSFKCVWGQEKIAPETTQARPSFGEDDWERAGLPQDLCSGFLPALPVCGWSLEGSRLPCLVNTNSNHARNLPPCQVQFFNVPLQGHSVSL